MEPLISIIVPVYNIKQYIEKCVHSICVQTYRNTEIILVDDGSSDGSGDVCEKLAEKCGNIIVIHKKNGGLSSARNCGIEASSGEYIMFVDGDDYIESNMCRKLYNALTAGKCDMAVCGVNCVDENGNQADNISSVDLESCENMKKEDYFLAMLGEDYWSRVVAWNKLYSRKLFEGLRYPEGRLHEDEFVIHKIVYKCRGIACVPERLYNYVQRPESIMHKKYSASRLDIVDAFFEREEFYFEKHVPDDIIIKNFYWFFNIMADAFSKSDMKCGAYRERFAEIFIKYKKTAKKIIKYKLPVLRRVYFALSILNPRIMCKITHILHSK